MVKPTSKQSAVLRQVIDAGLDLAASVLNTLFNSPIRLEIPFLKVLSQSDLMGELAEFGDNRISAVEMDFKGHVSGTLCLVLKKSAASALVLALAGGEPVDPDEDSIRQGALCEVGNIVLNAVIGSLANLLNLRFVFSVPSYVEETVERQFGVDQNDPDESILLVRTRFVVDELSVDGNIVLFIKVKVLKELLKAIDASLSDDRGCKL